MQGRMEFGPRARAIAAFWLRREFVLHREPEYFHQASRAVPQVRRISAGRARERILEVVRRAISGDRGPGAAGPPQDLRGRHPGGRSVRVHVVSAEDTRFITAAARGGKTTRLPSLNNTSFNLFGDPLVCTPRTQCAASARPESTALFVGNFLLEK